MGIRTIIVEDEPLARDFIRTLLSTEADIELVAECENGLAAVTAILDLVPQLLILDIRIPEIDGFAVLEAVRDTGGRLPIVIFSTAYDTHAIRAFDFNAVDYLLKPYDRERFTNAITRARSQIARREMDDLNEKVLAVLGEVRKSRPSFMDRFVVQSSGRVYFVPVDEIDWIEAAANYLCLHTGKSSHLVRATMQTIEDKLDPNKFLRIHRSAIVNIQRIRELQPWFHGEYKVILRDGTSLALSRNYRDRLQTLLGQPLQA